MCAVIGDVHHHRGETEEADGYQDESTSAPRHARTVPDANASKEVQSWDGRDDELPMVTRHGDEFAGEALGALPAIFGTPPGTRTPNLVIKSHLL